MPQTVDVLHCPLRDEKSAALSGYNYEYAPPRHTQRMTADSDRTSAEPYRTLRKLWTGTTDERPCSHVELIQKVTPSITTACAECAELGDDFLHLRICLICGYVGCCDLAKNHHMRNHYEETGHPFIQSFEPMEDWIWCYVDEAVLAPPEWLGGLSRLRTK